MRAGEGVPAPHHIWTKHPQWSPVERASLRVSYKMSHPYVKRPTDKDAAGHPPFRQGPNTVCCLHTAPTDIFSESIGHSDGEHLSTEPSPGRSSGPLWLTPAEGHQLGCSRPELPENPETHPDSSTARSPWGPQTHGQMICTQSNEQ